MGETGINEVNEIELATGGRMPCRRSWFLCTST
jgi:hypothetical protein